MNTLSANKTSLETTRIYSALLPDVLRSKCASKRYDKQWFEESSLRFKTYEKTRKLIKGLIFNKSELIPCTVKSLWNVCIFSAPMALTLIAPEESYKSDEELLSDISLFFKKEDLDNYPSIQLGIQSLEQVLAEPIRDRQGFSILCNLYAGTHVFLIEKRKMDSCILYQSYLDCDGKDNYSFDNFLTNQKMHFVWKPKKLISKIRKIISRELPDAKRLKSYKKLFFCCNLQTFAKKDAEYEYPLTFIATDFYPLKHL